VRSKKAQFYLIAAIIIIGIIIILSSVTNYIVTKKKPVKMYDLGEEFKEEGTRVVDYGLYDSNPAETRDTVKLMEALMSNFSVYSEEKEKGSELVFVFGNSTNLTSVTYTSQNTGTVKLTVPGSPSGYEVPAATIKKPTVNSTDPSLIIPPPPFDQVQVKILDQTYEFELHEGENFFFVIAKNVTDTNEMYITKKT